MGLVCFLRETAKQTAGLLLPEPAADELKILPQTRACLQPAVLKRHAQRHLTNPLFVSSAVLLAG
jgi:hypothetical protein